MWYMKCSVRRDLQCVYMTDFLILTPLCMFIFSFPEDLYMFYVIYWKSPKDRVNYNSLIMPTRCEVK